MTKADVSLPLKLNKARPGANPNFIRLLVNARNSQDLPLSNQLRKMAKEKYAVSVDELFKGNAGLSISYEISIAKGQNEAVVRKYSGSKVSICFSRTWFDTNVDYPTLLQNFVYLFEYVDTSMLVSLVSVASELGIVERFMTMYLKDDYRMGSAFRSKDVISNMQIDMYYGLLLHKGIRLEDVIEWFFKDYIEKEFNVSGYAVTLPSKNSTYLEKCSLLFPSMESMLKQFQAYVT